MALPDSSTYLALQACADHISKRFSQFELLVYDNSPSPAQMEAGAPLQYAYVHDPGNGGLAAAYNSGLEAALAHRSDWLLLLDQDTELTPAYFRALSGFAAELADRQAIAAAVPVITSRGVIVSPATERWTGRMKPLTTVDPVQERLPLVAINSGVIARVAFLQQIGGFDHTFWLDFLDHWLFEEIRLRQKEVVVLPTVIKHSLSLSDFSAVAPASVLSAK